MKELTQIRDAVIESLQAAGLDAMPAFPPQWAKEPVSPVAAVSVGAAEGKNFAFSSYLGQTQDPSGLSQEVYGKWLHGVISVNVWAPRASDCDDAADLASSVLLASLPEGIQPGELSWEGLTWDKSSALFLRRGKLRCDALFIARSTEDDPVFLDFILKGVLHCEHPS